MVTAGKVADLDAALNVDQTKKFPREKDRKLSARFLEDLLTGMLPGVKPHRTGVRIRWAVIDERLDLSNAQNPWEVWLDYCQFGSDAIFTNASFGGIVSFDGSTFRADANFEGMKVGDSIFFQKAIFEGSVKFLLADIALNFQAVEAQFRNKEKNANFNSMKVGHSAFFGKAVFEGSVDFGAANITSNLEAPETQFKNHEQVASFNAMKVGDLAVFEKAVFEGPVNFVAADIGSDFLGNEVQFTSKTETVWLSMKCGRVGHFSRATFAGPVYFTDSSFLSLMIIGASPNAAPVSMLNLSRSSIKRQLRIEKISILDLVARSLHVEGPAHFTDVIVENSADLSDGDFATLDLSRSTWPKNGSNGRAFHMRGMNYKYLRADANESKSHHALLNLADQSAFTADVYRGLEAFFLRQGYSSDADRAFIAGKRRERKEFLHGIRSFGSLLLDGLVGYGRHPWQAGIPCLFFVALGWVFFSPNKMELRDKKDAPRVYGRSDRFWYSIGLFLPFVDLQADKMWRPMPEQTFRTNYMRVHILLGWILIPILVAALTGLIK